MEEFATRAKKTFKKVSRTKLSVNRGRDEVPWQIGPLVTITSARLVGAANGVRPVLARWRHRPLALDEAVAIGRLRALCQAPWFVLISFGDKEGFPAPPHQQGAITQCELKIRPWNPRTVVASNSLAFASCSLRDGVFAGFTDFGQM